MSCIKSTGPVDLRVVATSTTEIFVPQTDWYPALGVDLVRFGFRLIAESGGIQGRPAYQTATAVIDEAGPGGRAVPQGLGTPVSGPMDALTFALNLGQVQWVRFGSMISLDQTGAPGQGDVLLQATFPACGKPLGRFVQQVHMLGQPVSGARKDCASRACSRSGCSAAVEPPYVFGTSSGPAHPILTFSALAGDLTLDQDPGVTGAFTQIRHSGVARGATVDAWSYSGKARLVEMVDDIIDLVGTGGQIEILSNTTSQGVGGCDPRHSQAKAWNELFEIASVLVFQSGGNGGSDSRDDCETSGGAAAPSSFVVNQMRNNERLRDPRSGNASRSVIDMTAFGVFDLAAWDSLGSAGAKGYAPVSGTSISTPLVAGIAALYTEMYRQQRSSRIDDPGLLKSNLLLMGDRTEGSLLGTSQTTVGYDSQWGAGKFSARTFRGAQGFLDGVWMSGRACVPHGKSRTIFHPVPTNARIVEAVAWSMDPRVSRNRAPNDVDLSVVEQTGTTTVTIPGFGTITLPIINELAADRASADEKERAFSEEAAPRATARPVGVRLKGMNIRGRDPVCGNNAERVYFAFRAEGT